MPGFGSTGFGNGPFGGGGGNPFGGGPWTTYTWTPGFVHGDGYVYAVAQNQFEDTGNQRYLASRTPERVLRFEYTFVSSGTVAEISSFFQDAVGPLRRFYITNHRTGESLLVRFAGAALSHTRGPAMIRHLNVDFVVVRDGQDPVGTQAGSDAVAACLRDGGGGLNVVPAPLDPNSGDFLGVQAPEGAGLWFWQSVTSASELTGWQVAGANRVGWGNATIASSLSLIAVPFIVPRSGAILGAAGIAVKGTHTNSRVGMFGVYVARSVNDLYPGSFYATIGTVSLTDDGVASVATSLQLPVDNMYYLTFITSGFHGASAVLNTTGVTDAEGIAVVSRDTNVKGFLRMTTDAASFPAPFPSSATNLTGDGTFTTGVPALLYRFIG